MAQSFVQVPTDSTGKKIDTQTTTTAAQHRQVVVVGDPATDANVASADAANGLDVDVTRLPGTTLDYDTGGGTQTMPVIGIALPASGGSVAGGTATNPLQVSLANTAANATAVKVDNSAVTQPVSDAAGSLTVDAPVATPVFVRLSDGAAAITALPVTDNAGALTVDNGGTFAVQVDGSALTALQVIDNPVLVDDAGFTPATSSVMMAGFEADESATDSVDEGDAGAARMTLDRKVITNPQPHTAGGLSTFRSIDLDETEEEVKGTAGQIYGIWFSNMATTTRFLKLYNDTAANVIVGTTTPQITFALPGNSTDDISGMLSSTHGITFSAAITAAATTGIADADTGAPAANDVIVNIFYK